MYLEDIFNHGKSYYQSIIVKICKVALATLLGKTSHYKTRYFLEQITNFIINGFKKGYVWPTDTSYFVQQTELFLLNWISLQR